MQQIRIIDLSGKRLATDPADVLNTEENRGPKRRFVSQSRSLRQSEERTANFTRYSRLRSGR